MKDVELVSELLASLANGGLINKKAAVDRAIEGKESMGTPLSGLCVNLRADEPRSQDVSQSYATRFHNLSEFYSLFMVVFELQQQN